MLTNIKGFFFLLFFSLIIACNTTNEQAQGAGHHSFTNELINESSPYLLQHAHNPVQWHPWGERALAKAKSENKMLIISVGYAACHWCHVMEHESFEDTTVARIMNEHFIAIKVDREERPDIDDVYMTACQLASNKSCGWPLNSFALPDGRPVWAGTYFPKKQWLEVMEYFIKLRKEEPEQLENFATQITQGIQQNGWIGLNKEAQEFNQATIQKLATVFYQTIDDQKGGRFGAPKFPMPNNYAFLLKYYHLFGDEKALKAVQVTLDKMAEGGIYDQLGGGFARYSTDEEWKVPHFEKMLYDNGQLVSLYAQAWKVTKKPLYQKIVEETLTYIAREMTSPEGGFYSSLDADSEGEEGKFYVWKKSEIDSILGDEKTAAIFNDYYEVRKGGNWEDNNILFRKKTIEEVAKTHHITPEEVNNLLQECKHKLMEVRAQRVRPGLDNKVLTSWNALMLKGYVDAYQAFGTADYLSAALKNAEFISQKMMQKDGRLNRNYKDGKSVINAFLDDYALTAQAFTALYEVTFDEKWLNLAKNLTDYAITHFFDAESGMFFYTSNLDAALIARKMEITDNVIPASNSVMANNLHRLGLYFYQENYLQTSKQMLHNLQSTMVDLTQPSFYSNWLTLYLDFVHPTFEVAVVGDSYQPLQKALLQQYLPDALLLGGKNEGNLTLLKGKWQEGETMIYVCQNKVCKLPVGEVTKALELMKR